ncbi:FGGY family carbohydrate kinase [Puia sp. P3]|uniref:FGGY family carbohydrate kinase n=1 Tax=Puia sp. P3 TaxID=3423952 RepID=UPI003D6740E8
MDCIISIELGTNAVRVYAFDLQGQIIGFAKGTYPTFHPYPDYSEQDPEQIFITMLYVLKNLLNEKIHSKKHKVVSMCFSASMHSLLAVDKGGAPLGNLITWADNRGQKEAGALQGSSMAEEIYKATGTPIHPMSPLVKIVWMKNQRPDVFAQTAKFMSLKSYIIQQLTGQVILDHSLASATGLMNIYKKEWDPVALAYAGIRADRAAGTGAHQLLSGKTVESVSGLAGSAGGDENTCRLQRRLFCNVGRRGVGPAQGDDHDRG